jgi:hypothetical protein
MDDDLFVLLYIVGAFDDPLEKAATPLPCAHPLAQVPRTVWVGVGIVWLFVLLTHLPR